jgi:hypothetical protein
VETLTLSQIEERYDTTRKAIARRVERGSVRSLLDEAGRRVVPVAELERAGLRPRHDPDGEGEPRGEPRGVETNDLGPLLDRLERLVAENARLRLLTEQAESLQATDREDRFRLEAELKTARERIAELEAQPRRRRWFRRVP